MSRSRRAATCGCASSTTVMPSRDFTEVQPSDALHLPQSPTRSTIDPLGPPGSPRTPPPYAGPEPGPTHPRDEPDLAHARSTRSDTAYASQTSFSAPFGWKLGHSAHYNSEPEPPMDSRRQVLLNEMSGKFVGPMPVHQFLDEFLPIASSSTVGLQKTHIERLATAATATAEKDMYPCIVSLPLSRLTRLVLSYHACDS
jgi:hypothetical protein